MTNALSKALCNTPSKNLFFFSKSGILDRSYGSLKQNLHHSSVVHQHSAVRLTVLDFLKTIKGEVSRISNGKMLIITSSWQFFGNFCSQVQQFLAWTMTEFALGVYKLHTTQYFDLIFLPHELSYLRQFKSFT